MPKIPFAKSLLSAALLTASLSSLTAPASAEDCQARLEAAIASIKQTPFRAKIARDPNRSGFSKVENVSFNDYDNMIVTSEDHYSGSAAALAKKEYGASRQVREAVFIGAKAWLLMPDYKGQWEKFPDGDHDERIKDSALQFANSDSYYAAACNGETIGFIYNPSFPDSEYKTFDARDKARKAQDADRAAKGQQSLSVDGQVTLDAKTDRPVRFRMGDYNDISPQQPQMTITVDYTSAITITQPDGAPD
jgi:hypothetical protein